MATDLRRGGRFNLSFFCSLFLTTKELLTLVCEVAVEIKVGIVFGSQCTSTVGLFTEWLHSSRKALWIGGTGFLQLDD